MNRLLLGCIADDFTGASDAASFLYKEGVNTLLLNGIPEGWTIDLEGVDAVVIALKTRTIPAADAVRMYRGAAAWLRSAGAEKFYFKYCSTFDSTEKGNIGPVSDLLMESTGCRYTVICPSLLVNGRWVKDGLLYINDKLLHETSMKDHPLTPMRESDLTKLMAPQSRYPSFIMTGEMMDWSFSEIQELLDEWGRDNEHFYIVPDYNTDDQGDRIVELFGGLPVLTGGSGLLTPVGKSLNLNSSGPTVKDSTTGPGIILAGSCAEATLGQIERFKEMNLGPWLKIEPLKVLDGTQSITDVSAFLEENQGKTVLIYSSDSTERVREVQREGKFVISNELENLTAEICFRAVSMGYKRLIVAGGETSGAVVSRLGFNAYRIGSSVAPGVPVMAPVSDPSIRIVLKSGKFGDSNFFGAALKMTLEE